MRLTADGDLALLHGFEQGGLDFGGGSVDFVGEDEIGEDGAAVGGEFAVFRREDHGAYDVAGEEVGRELDALKLDAEGGAEGLDEERLGEAGHTLEQHVAVGEEGDEEALDHCFLADDGLGDFGAEFEGPGGTVEHNRRLKAKEMRTERDSRSEAGLTRRCTKSFNRKTGAHDLAITNLRKTGGPRRARERRGGEVCARTGPGGQKINKTSSTVWLRHGPTGVEVRCQRERSQAANRAVAWAELAAKLETRKRGAAAAVVDAREEERRRTRQKSRRQKVRMIQTKKHRAKHKAGRGRVGRDDG